MKLQDLKSNMLYIIVLLLGMGYYSYAAMFGMAFWQSSGVLRNAAYRGVVPHAGYGARFYHK